MVVFAHLPCGPMGPWGPTGPGSPAGPGSPVGPESPLEAVKNKLQCGIGIIGVLISGGKQGSFARTVHLLFWRWWAVQLGLVLPLVLDLLQWSQI